MTSTTSGPTGHRVTGGVLAEDLQALRAGSRGTSSALGEEDYDDRRRLWNGAIDRRPLLIASCAGVSDVLAVVKFAREHGVPLAVRGGGHNFAGNAMCDSASSSTSRACGPSASTQRVAPPARSPA